MTEFVKINQEAVVNCWRHWRRARVQNGGSYTSADWQRELAQHGITLRGDGAVYEVTDEGSYVEFLLRWR